MQGINMWAVLVAGLASFVASSIWYIVFGKAMAQLSPAFAQAQQHPQPWKLLATLAVQMVLAYVVAFVLAHFGAIGWVKAAGVGVVLWAGFAATQWAGSILWENVPVKLALIHAGDWLMHFLIIATIVGAWRR